MVGGGRGRCCVVEAWSVVVATGAVWSLYGRRWSWWVLGGHLVVVVGAGWLVVVVAGVV